MMKPILFSTPMVRAILEGRKTQTRRVVTPQPKPASSFEGFCIGGNVEELTGKFYWKLKSDLNALDVAIRPPYKQGEIMWVRETWCDISDLYYYRADCKSAYESQERKWKPSIFMPREAARIFLEVKNVRIERLQDITDEDAKKEGLEEDTSCYRKGIRACMCWNVGSKFICLWDELNAKRGYGWDVNPWVWVYEFGRTEP